MPIAARKESGADRNRGKERIRSTKSSGISGIIDAPRGEGRTGLAGFVSTLKDLIRESESGIGAPPPLNCDPLPLLRLILIVVSRSSWCPRRQCAFAIEGRLAARQAWCPPARSRHSSHSGREAKCAGAREVMFPCEGSICRDMGPAVSCPHRAASGVFCVARCPLLYARSRGAVERVIAARKLPI